MTTPETVLVEDFALEQRVSRRVFVIAAAFLVAAGTINALTILTEAHRAGGALDARVPFILEYSSIVVMLTLVPLLAKFERRMPFTYDTWRSALLWHLLGTFVFTLLHVAGFIALRAAAYGLILGRPFVPFHDPMGDLLYEYRKDLLPYTIVVLMLGVQRALEHSRREAAAARTDARQSGKLTLKAGARTILLDAASLEWASAAGNYVEVRANGITHLARISLSGLEQLLAEARVDVVRVHRSHIVNRDKVREIAPARDGDFRIHMADGTELRGSRRYRNALPG